MEELESLGRELAQANQARTEVMNRIKEAIRRADRQGMPREQIMRKLGVAKQTVYDALEDK